MVKGMKGWMRYTGGDMGYNPRSNRIRKRRMKQIAELFDGVVVVENYYKAKIRF